MKKVKYIIYNPATNGVRWIENARQGLRLKGFADAISTRIRHNGWCADYWQDTVYRGIVYQLPARNGEPQFISGYADPCNDDCALLDFSTINTCEIAAAHQADRFAQLHAERDKEEWLKDQAAYAIEELKDSISTTRQSIIKLCADMRKMRQTTQAPPSICDALRAQVASLLKSIKHDRRTITKWQREPYSMFN